MRGVGRILGPNSTHVRPEFDRPNLNDCGPMLAQFGQPRPIPSALGSHGTDVGGCRPMWCRRRPISARFGAIAANAALGGEFRDGPIGGWPGGGAARPVDCPATHPTAVPPEPPKPPEPREPPDRSTARPHDHQSVEGAKQHMIRLPTQARRFSQLRGVRGPDPAFRSPWGPDVRGTPRGRKGGPDVRRGARAKPRAGSASHGSELDELWPHKHHLMPRSGILASNGASGTDFRPSLARPISIQFWSMSAEFGTSSTKVGANSSEICRNVAIFCQPRPTFVKLGSISPKLGKIWPVFGQV